MLTTLAIANYRSIQEMALPLSRLNVVTGSNGKQCRPLRRCAAMSYASA